MSFVCQGSVPFSWKGTCNNSSEIVANAKQMSRLNNDRSLLTETNIGTPRTVDVRQDVFPIDMEKIKSNLPNFYFDSEVRSITIRSL